MRKLILTLLLAGTAVSPALAQDRDWSTARRDRGNQSAQSDDSQRSRPSRARSEQSESSEPRWRPQRRSSEGGSATTSTTTTTTVEAPRRRTFDRQPDSTPQTVQRDRDDRSFVERAVERSRARRDTPVVVDTDRSPSRDQARRDRDANRQWTSHWRSDNRYDWRSHRDRHRSLYRWGRYYDPYGWGYRRFSIGFSLWPSYYGSSFWMDDPWMYRLPPAYGPYRWVRYWDDALLVDIYTGRVVDVVHNFFW